MFGLIGKAASGEDAQPTNTSALKVAEAFFEAEHLDESLRFQTERLSKTYAEHYAKDGGKSDPATVEAVQHLIAPEFQCYFDNRRKHYIAAYAKNYSTGDMMQLIEWTKTPLGQRWLAAQTSLRDDLVADQASELHETLKLAWDRHRQDFSTLGLTFGGPRK